MGIRFYAGEIIDEDDDWDCPTCYGMQVIDNVRWAAFFKANPKVHDLICAYFSVNDWRALPHFTAICPDCDKAAASDDEADDDIPF